ncbi:MULTISPECIES: hypothetical protein [unclassified Paenibacillus]|uniref:hypothetical protein n=1 Tax=unclassified Paenibacillus TaxID=185978 RepID=UPI0024069013|nr:MULTISPECIES: hypothetical protein [unclassified Paenibacillus]MDF9845545.1 ferredoxin-fold anticodon binding domain-containing protein [Paenibacillus sp. PastF-2]MDF9852125.1 ferredoxin-fold anticodon binding domain-containing protein [Paenibacillus sp. PastM-2]MDF9858706.1 ferredoxin-fold anticodon binding domain-containing protein [Paenibacillus sp. PastF-1]MDH6483962.1 ferredoxin-fold anticodon binding domain-containing protein [Paenibacillus sp. PastH-2]MDH6511341.1 ferredoxin-fold ant
MLIDLATGPLTAEREEEETSHEVPAMSAASIYAWAHEKHFGTEKTAYPSYTQNLVEHGLFEKDFIIKHNLELLRVLSNEEAHWWLERKAVLKTLMNELGIEEQKPPQPS